jgi:hypothetical protein
MLDFICFILANERPSISFKLRCRHMAVACWRVAVALQRVSVAQVSRKWRADVAQVSRPCREPAAYCRKPDASLSNPGQYPAYDSTYSIYERNRGRPRAHPARCHSADLWAKPLLALDPAATIPFPAANSILRGFSWASD